MQTHLRYLLHRDAHIVVQYQYISVIAGELTRQVLFTVKGRIKRHIDTLAVFSFKVARLAQHTIKPGRGDFEDIGIGNKVLTVKNLLQVDLSVYPASDDTLRNYKFGDNLFRLYTNFGYRAFSRWFYTIDGELKTPLVANYKKNTNVRQVALLSPYIAPAGGPGGRVIFAS